MTETVYIGLGSNLGDREKFLSEALGRLREIDGLEIVALSAIYVSPALETADDSPAFLNQVVKAEYAASPMELLHSTERIESELGRDGKGERRARTIDIDILLFGERHVKTDQLQIPHPGLTRRLFALSPILEIDPDLVHPVTGEPLADCVKRCDQTQIDVYRDHVARQI